MSFLAGFVQQMNTIRERNDRFREQEADRAERREMFMQKLIADQRNVLIPHLLEYEAKKNEFLVEQKKIQKDLKTSGFSNATIAILTSAGKGEEVLSSIIEAKKDGRFNPSAVRQIDEYVKSYAEEKGADITKIGDSLVAGVRYGDMNDPANLEGIVAIRQVLESDTPMDIAKEVRQRQRRAMEVRPEFEEATSGLEGIPLNVSGVRSLKDTEDARLRSIILQTVADQVDPGKVKFDAMSGTANYEGDDNSVLQLANRIYNDVLDQAMSPSATTDLETIKRSTINTFLGRAAKLDKPSLYQAYGLPYTGVTIPVNNALEPKPKVPAAIPEATVGTPTGTPTEGETDEDILYNYNLNLR